MFQSTVITAVFASALLLFSIITAVPIPPELIGGPVQPTVISTQILPSQSGIMTLSYAQVLQLLDLSVETKQMFQTTQIALRNRDVNHTIAVNEVITNYCSSFQPFFVGDSYCNTQQVNARLPLDLQYLKELQPILTNVIQYQEENTADNIILSSYLSYCQNKLSLLITSLQTALSPAVASDNGEQGSGDSQNEEEGAGAANNEISVIDNTYQPNTGNNNNKPSYCYNCTSIADQFYTIKEIHIILQWTTDDINCVKNQLNNN